MSLVNTPLCNFDEKIIDFKLLSTDNKVLSLNDVKGQNGTLIMFICNHCPYVKAVIDEIVNTVDILKLNRIGSVAIMPNDVEEYPQDNFENMKIFAQKHNFNFPYLIDMDQSIAKNFNAICTPDFFGYNFDGLLQYRGRIKELEKLIPTKESKNELLEAMLMVSKTRKGPKKQFPSMGCSIKWKNN